MERAWLINRFAAPFAEKLTALDRNRARRQNRKGKRDGMNKISEHNNNFRIYAIIKRL